MHWPPETFLQWRLKGLTGRGHRVTVATPDPPGETPAGLEGVERLQVPHWVEPAPVQLLGALGSAARLLVREPRTLARLVNATWRWLPPDRRSVWELVLALRLFLPLARLRPDVVHFEWESAAITHRPLFDIWAAPVVVSCHGSGVNRHPHMPDQRAKLLHGLPIVFDRAAAVHCVSRAVAGEAGRYGLDPAKARVIPSSVDPDFFRPLPGRSDGSTLRVVAVSRLIWSKGYEYALHAIRLLLDEGVPAQFEIFGGIREGTNEPYDLDRIHHTIRDLGLEDSVRLHGLAGSERVRDGLQAADVLLHISLSDGMPTVVVEAMACGLPVVASAVGGTPEAVRDGIDGIVVPPRDPRSAAAALARLWERPELREQMGRAGRERVCSEFTLERLLDGFEDLYAAACNGRRPAPRLDLAPAIPARPPSSNGRTMRPLRVFSAGAFGWEQGHEYTLQALALLKSSGVRCELRLAGEGAYVRPIAYARHQLGLTDVVELVGPADAEVVEQHLRWADVFVCCAVADDGSSAAAHAALARGVPVVATERAGLTAEELERGGLSVPVRDPAAVSDRLEELARRRDARHLVPHP